MAEQMTETDPKKETDQTEKRQEETSSLTLLSVREFTDRLSGKDPVPGGGGAAALAAALASALGRMTAELAIGKKRYANNQKALEELSAQSGALIEELLACVDQDAENFLPLLGAYGLPRGTQREKEARDAAIGAALMKANEVPLQIMRLCLRVLRFLDEAEKKGSRMAVSDAGAGVKLAEAALEAASLNVYINAKNMEDKKTARRQIESADAMVREGRQLSDVVYSRVLEEIRG